LRKDERLKTIYETIAPHITRSEIAWRDYLKFASKFFKYSFDNALLVYAQNPNVTMLAPTQFGIRLDDMSTKVQQVLQFANMKTQDLLSSTCLMFHRPMAEM
jgi:hypothetical protein